MCFCKCISIEYVPDSRVNGSQNTYIYSALVFLLFLTDPKFDNHLFQFKNFSFDADPSLQDLLLRFQYSNTHTHRLQRSCGGKGTAQPLSQEENASECLSHSLKGGNAKSIALTSLYRFSRPLTSKKVLFYYTKVCLGWLSLQTQERKSLNTSKEDICNVKGEMVQTAMSHTWKVQPRFQEDKDTQ